MRRPPLPRGVLAWVHQPDTTPRDPGDPAFIWTDDDLADDRRAIRTAVGSQRAWHERAQNWITAHGYSAGEWLQAREVAQGLTPEQCAAVTFTSSGCVIALTVKDLHALDGGSWGPPRKPTIRRAERHSISDPLTPETDGAKP